MSTISSISNTLGQVGNFPKTIEDVTNSIAKSGQFFGKLHNGVSDIIDKINNTGRNVSQGIKPFCDVANEISRFLRDIEDLQDIVNASSLLVNAIVHAGSGKFNPKEIAAAFSQFDKDWDTWAKTINEIFNKLSPTQQANILETIAKELVGNNIYNLFSAIKNESAGIFSGIAAFKSALDAFGGSYDNLIDAMKKIETGLKGIVTATEQIANSVNNFIKTLLNGKDDFFGSKILSYLGNLHNTKAISVLNKVLSVGGGAASLFTDGSALASALKSKNPTAIYQAGKKTIDDVKAIIDALKDNSAATKVTSLSQSAAKNANSAANNPAESKKNDGDDSGNSDSYVCSGATMKCTFGDKSAKLTVYPDRTVFLTGQPMANISDYISMYNINPFGKCRTTSFPPTGAATAAAQGALTPMPCVPGTNSNWLNGKDDYIIKGNPALLKSSYCKCCYGGVITITDDGQK